MSTAARVPAWKRLGLKLGGGGDQATTASPASSIPTPANSSSAVKRKASSSVPTPDQSAKKSKTGFQASSDSTTTPSKRAKTVSFASETTPSSSSATVPTGARFAPSSAEQGPEGKDIIRNKPKQKQQPPAPKKSTAIAAAADKKLSSGPAPPINLGPALEYLRKWHGSRDTWKFNKNHQTKLLEQVFAEETTIPAADIDIFYEYIRPLKGHVRQRLRELANGVITRDAETGVKGFPSTMANNKKDAAKKQDEYERVVETFLAKERPAPGQGKPRFQEVDYVLRTADMEMQRRVVKRMRAQVVLDELADGTDEAGGAAQAANGSEGSAAAGNAGGDGLAIRASLNDGSQQRVKRKRKTRTAVVDEYDSSSSEDDGSSDESSGDDEAEGSAVTKTKQQKVVPKAKDDSSSDSDSSSDASSDEDSDSDSD